MKISLEAFGVTHTKEMPDDITIDRVIDVWIMLTESAGFSDELVTKALNEAIEKRI